MLNYFTTNENIKWSSITVLSFVFFFWLIPVNIYSSLLYLIVILSAGLVTFSLLRLLISVFFGKKKVPANVQCTISEQEKVAMVERGKDSGCLILFIVVACFFALSALFIFHEIKMENDELDNYGQLTTGTIKGGSSISSRRNDFTDLIIGFKKADGDSMFVKHAISAAQFNNYYKYQNLPIIYSTRYPTILKIIGTRTELEEYLKKHQKNNYRGYLQSL